MAEFTKQDIGKKARFGVESSFFADDNPDSGSSKIAHIGQLMGANIVVVGTIDDIGENALGITTEPFLAVPFTGEQVGKHANYEIPYSSIKSCDYILSN
tara:strand:+ start:195 stop:491 length:297 start_codon:yes stop_codon:yes gene_type:complete